MMLGKAGFAIIEILIAITILSIVLMGIISGVSAGVVAISANKNLTRAIIIAKSRLNEFLVDNMRGPDIQGESVKEYPGFTYSRQSKRYEHELFGPIGARKVDITITWQERGRDKKYTFNYIYPEQ